MPRLQYFGSISVGINLINFNVIKKKKWELKNTHRDGRSSPNFTLSNIDHKLSIITS